MFSALVASLLVLTPFTSAQVTSKCNPLTTSCPANPGLSTESYSVDFTTGQKSDWTGSAAAYSGQGVAQSVAGANDSPTLYSSFYFLFGRVEAKIKAAPGVGIVSSLVLLSDALDEIDWEWLGASPGLVQTNYFGKGNTTTYDREQNANVAGGSTSTYHTYAIDWTSAAIVWSIDGTTVRTLNYADAVGGKNFPQTPCRIGFGNWPAGASPNQGTREWAGGAVDFSQGPFTMYTESISLVNYNPAQSYSYGDESGSYQSIQITGGKSSSVIGSGSNSNANANANANANSGSGAVSPSSASSPAAAAPSPIPTSTTPAQASSNPYTTPPSPVSSYLPSSPNSNSSASTGTNVGQTTTQSTSITPSTTASSAPISQSSTATSSTSTTITTKTSTSSLSTSTVHSSSTTSRLASSATTSTSPSTAPNAATATFDMNLISGTLVGMFAFAIGMQML